MSAMAKLNLRPFERRLLMVVLVAVFLAVNVVFVWPHFKDWGETKDRLEGATGKIGDWSKIIAQKTDVDKKIEAIKDEGGNMVDEDQANQFFRTVQNQASISGVSLPGIMRSTTSTNLFFIELLQTFRVSATESNLVDFLYSLGEGESAVRARSLSLRPNGPRQQLEGSIDLVASYQKNPRKAAPKPEVRPAAKPPAAPQPASAPKSTAKKS